jgi:hypothetical protein
MLAPIRRQSYARRASGSGLRATARFCKKALHHIMAVGAALVFISSAFVLRIDPPVKLH